MAQRTLRVHANPWASLDHEGRPAGHCAFERQPQHVNNHQGYVACECVASEPEKLPLGHAGTPDQDTCWHFSKEPVEVVDGILGYYRRCLRDGDILPADEKTARVAGIAFTPIDQAWAAAKKLAYSKWFAAFGENPAEVDPFQRPRPAGKEAPQDVTARSGAARAASPAKPATKKEGA